MPINVETAKNSDGSVTALLIRLSQGDRTVENLLLPQIYDELRRIARYYMRNERRNHTLQATALVHQAYVRLAESPQIDCQSRSHFLALAARAMRHVLADYADAHNAERRGGGWCRVSWGDALAASEDQAVEGLAFKQALDRLSKLNERHAQVAELRALAGLSFDEIGSVLNMSGRNAKRDWLKARAFLRLELSKHE